MPEMRGYYIETGNLSCTMVKQITIVKIDNKVAGTMARLFFGDESP